MQQSGDSPGPLEWGKTVMMRMVGAGWKERTEALALVAARLSYLSKQISHSVTNGGAEEFEKIIKETDDGTIGQQILQGCGRSPDR